MSDRSRLDPVPVAAWRGLSTPCGCCGRAILSFDMEDGSVLRLMLPREARADLAGALTAVGSSQVRCRNCGVQSPSSSGRPHSDGSIPLEGQNVYPPARSSSAASGV